MGQQLQVDFSLINIYSRNLHRYDVTHAIHHTCSFSNQRLFGHLKTKIVAGQGADMDKPLNKDTREFHKEPELRH